MIPAAINLVLLEKSAGPNFIAILAGAYTQPQIVTYRKPLPKGAAALTNQPWPPKKDQTGTT